jgi:hypothetical protein
MTISSSTIAAIQKLGAQAFAAKEKLVASTNDYAEKVNAAMKKNPHDPAIAQNCKRPGKLSHKFPNHWRTLRMNSLRHMRRHHAW